MQMRYDSKVTAPLLQNYAEVTVFWIQNHKPKETPFLYSLHRASKVKRHLSTKVLHS